MDGFMLDTCDFPLDNLPVRFELEIARIRDLIDLMVGGEVHLYGQFHEIADGLKHFLLECQTEFRKEYLHASGEIIAKLDELDAATSYAAFLANPKTRADEYWMGDDDDEFDFWFSDYPS